MFGYGIDKKTLYIVLGIFAVFTIFSLGTSGILGILVSIPGIIIALTFHEFAHAFVAIKLGDSTPKLQGRNSLNPLRHIDWFGMIMLLVAGFGWGKPVQIDKGNFRNKKLSASAAEAIVALAGPIMNFLLAFIFSIVLYALVAFAPNFIFSLNGTVYEIVLNIVFINICLGIFNLIPIPPLDGSKVLMHFLPYNAKCWLDNNKYTFYIVLLLLTFIRIGGTSIIGRLLIPAANGVFSGFSFVATNIIKLFM